MKYFPRGQTVASAVLWLQTSLIIYLVIHPTVQRLLTVGSGFTALTVCSGRFVSGRNTTSIERNELAGIASALVSFSIDENAGAVYAFPKYLSPEIARAWHLPIAAVQYIDEYIGCKPVGDGNVQHDVRFSSPSLSKIKVPHLQTNIDETLQRMIDAEFTWQALEQNQTRAIVILHHGQVVAEGYQQLMGFHEQSKLLGWSMTKSLHAVIVGAAIQQGLFDLNTPARLLAVPVETREALFLKNRNRPVTMGDLLRMVDIIPFDEDYGISGSCPAMLFASDDMGFFASRVTKRPPLSKAAEIANNVNNNSGGVVDGDFVFDWYYSSGVSNVLAKELRGYFHSDEEYHQFPQKALFDKLGATFSIEVDPTGTFVASSFGYGSGRSWAIVAQLLLQKGIWNGERLLPEEFVHFLSVPHPYSGGHYGASFWLNPAGASLAVQNYMTEDHITKVKQHWLRDALPPDAYSMCGFDGQYNMIVPSLDLVIVRLGLTSDANPAAWDKSLFFGEIVKHFNQSTL